MKKYFIIALLFVQFLMMSSFFSTYALASETSNSTSENITSPNQVQMNDLYEALLQSKEDRIATLSSFVSWILTIAGLSLTIVILLFGWWSRALNKRKLETDELANELSERLQSVENVKYKMMQFLNESEFEPLQRALHQLAIENGYNHDLTKYKNPEPFTHVDDEFFTLSDYEEKYHSLKSIFELFLSKKLNVKMDTQRDINMFNDIKNYIEKEEKKSLKIVNSGLLIHK